MTRDAGGDTESGLKPAREADGCYKAPYWDPW